MAAEEDNAATSLAIFGLGYVGSVTAACFAARGHRVIGCDLNPRKVETIVAGQSPIVEPGLAERIRDGVASGHLRATTRASEALAAASIWIVCVGTPSRWNGSLDLTSVTNLCNEFGEALRRRDEHVTIVVRSTVLPGTVRKEVVPRLEHWSNKKAGRDFSVVINPEFLREGSAVSDFEHPPKTVIGSDEAPGAERVARLFAGIDAPLFKTSPEVAEAIKYTDNAWHALKVVFGNEIGNVCKSLGIDTYALMEIFCSDRKLNISTAYLRPGFAFGGSCLPKDVRALAHKARELDLELPILSHILDSNRIQIERALRLILSHGTRRVGMLGLAFKPATDDLRESPHVELVERLLGKGCSVRIYDPNVQMAFLTGANRDFIVSALPHISSLLVQDMDAILNECDTIVISNDDPAFRTVAERVRDDQILVDMAHIPLPRAMGNRYVGINW
jgi:GDP-mannose 6-dehydrogenase